MKFRVPDVSPEERQWRIRFEDGQATFAEQMFRVTEMILVCGIVVFIEKKLGVPAIASSILSAFVAIYARCRATAGFMSVMHVENHSERVRSIAYWAILYLTFLLFGAVVWLTNYAVPQIAELQS